MRGIEVDPRGLLDDQREAVRCVRVDGDVRRPQSLAIFDQRQRVPLLGRGEVFVAPAEHVRTERAKVRDAVGLVLRRGRGAAHVTGSVLAPTALAGALVFTPLSLGARALRLSTRDGVVVVSEVSLTGDDGAPVAGDAVPEAASVELGEHRGAQVHVRWGAAEGWAPVTSVRVLASR